MTQKKKWNKYGLVAVVILAVLAVLYMINLNFGKYLGQIWDAAKSVLVPAGIALFLVYLIAPINRRLKKKGMGRNGAATLSIVIFGFILLIFLGLIAFLITRQVLDIIPIVKDNWTNIIDTLAKFTEGTNFGNIIDENGINWAILMDVVFTDNDGGSILFTATISTALKVLYWFIVIVMTPVFLFFFLREGENIFNGIVKVIPKKWYKDDINNIMKFANSSTEKYIRGKLISIFFLSLFFGITFAITFLVLAFTLGWKITAIVAILYGLLFGGILALLDLVPYIGPGLGIILPIFFLLVVAGFGPKFFIFTGILIVIDIIGQNLQKVLIEPVIMSKEVDIHPLTVFVGMLFFGALFGVVGLILATPIVATIRSVYEYLMGKYSVEQIEMITNTDIDGDGNIGKE